MLPQITQDERERLIAQKISFMILEVETSTRTFDKGPDGHGKPTKVWIVSIQAGDLVGTLLFNRDNQQRNGVCGWAKGHAPCGPFLLEQHPPSGFLELKKLKR